MRGLVEGRAGGVVARQALCGAPGGSILGQSGLDDQVACGASDYAERTLALVNDVDRLRALRSGIRARIAGV
ncbi:MAG TPA: hypothetical protein PLQ64_02425 [Thiobacillaceae bacterium]|nr:hypothetical protein [Thiobacillaceae bacterium]HNH87945.1 hypothetical protein [Thiobacillaceae bacterium]HNI06541.1 hypothetical protein [Thiobacillaceae bacterium]